MGDQPQQALLGKAYSTARNSRAVRLLLSPWAWPLEIVLVVIATEIFPVLTGERTARQGGAAVIDTLSTLIQSPWVHGLVVLAAFISFYLGVKRLEIAEQTKAERMDRAAATEAARIAEMQERLAAEYRDALEKHKSAVSAAMRIPNLMARYFVDSERLRILQAHAERCENMFRDLQTEANAWRRGELHDPGGRKGQAFERKWRELVSQLREDVQFAGATETLGRTLRTWEFELEQIRPLYEPLDERVGPHDPNYRYVAENNGPFIAAFTRARDAIQERLGWVQKKVMEKRSEIDQLRNQIQKAINDAE